MVDWKNFLKKNWPLFVLGLIFILSLQTRLLSDVENLTALDPYFHLRHTETIVDNGSLGDWDYLSYAPAGRPADYPPLMYYVTAWLYKMFGGVSNASLTEFAIFMPALFGALTVIPSYLLGKELSGKIAGLLAAVFITFSPAIIQRTMAGFYDTDGLVIFFSVLVMWSFVRAFKRTKFESQTLKGCTKEFFAHGHWINYLIIYLSIILFALTWPAAWYIPIIAIGSIFMYFGLLSIFGKKEWIEVTDKKRIKPDFGKRIRLAFPIFLKIMIPSISIFILSVLTMEVLGYTAIKNILLLASFVRDSTSVLIVNQSVAELQKINIFNNFLGTFYSRISISIIFALSGAVILFKRNLLMGSVLLTWALVSFISILQGIRFMLVFAPAMGIAGGIALAEIYRGINKSGDNSFIIALGLLAGAWVAIYNPIIAFFIVLVSTTMFLILGGVSKVPDRITKSLLIATMIVSVLITISQGAQIASAYQGSEPIEGEWEEAYTFLRERTANDAIVGTWWDPGHRIATVGERRNIADGAHCPKGPCDPGMNERITDLGFIFSTNNEELAKERLLKYRGNSSEMYWIVSDDLIQKFQWLQFFGTACDFRRDSSCELYTRLDRRSFSYNPDTYEIATYQFGENVLTVNQDGRWLAVIETENGAIPFTRQITHINGNPTFIPVNGDANRLVWIHPENEYVVAIPESLERNMLTRMFFYEDGGLENFELVFKNNKVKIFKLLI